MIEINESINNDGNNTDNRAIIATRILIKANTNSMKIMSFKRNFLAGSPLLSFYPLLDPMLFPLTLAEIYLVLQSIYAMLFEERRSSRDSGHHAASRNWLSMKCLTIRVPGNRLPVKCNHGVP